MKRAVLVSGALVVLAAGAWLSWSVARPARTRGEAVESAAPAGGEERELEAAPSSGAVAEVAEGNRETVDAAPAAEPNRLRGRVLTESGDPIEGWRADLSYAGDYFEYAESDADGRFEFPPPLRPGTELHVWPLPGWELERAVLELDAVPADELLFVAYELPAGPVHGVVVDERDATPVPFLAMSVGNEELVTDASGAFATLRAHPRGRLRFQFPGWTYDLGGFDPERPEALIVPARLGPAFYFTLDGSVQRPNARLLEEPPESAAAALALDGPWCTPLLEPRGLARFPSVQRGAFEEAELVLVSQPDFLFARAPAGPGLGTAVEPLQMTLRPCGFLGVNVAYSRHLEWYEDDGFLLTLCLGSTLLRTKGARLGGQASFVIASPGEARVEASFRGESVGSVQATTRLGESVVVALRVELPESRRDESPEEEHYPVRGRVVRTRNHPLEWGQLRLTRADGEEALLQLHWTKEDGRWTGRFAGEAPAGEYRAALEIDPPFKSSGPRTVRVPATDELLYEVADDVPLVSVSLAPIAAESGVPLLSFAAVIVLNDGNAVRDSDACSPSAPVVEGYPRDVPFTWLCTAAGRRVASGRFEPDGKEGDLRIPASLERGWGAFLYFGGPTYEPLEGVRVLLDGVAAGATGSHGFVGVGAPERPARITLEYRDWQIFEGQVNADGTFDDSEVEMNVYLAPPR